MRTIRDEDGGSGGHAIADVKCTRATEKAILCVIDGEDVWIPQSQVHDDSEVYQVGDEGKLVVTAWFAGQKGWA